MEVSEGICVHYYMKEVRAYPGTWKSVLRTDIFHFLLLYNYKLQWVLCDGNQTKRHIIMKL